MITLEHVSKVYGNKTAVADLNLRVAAGELFAFLGPNGAGKTTTIKMMCGLLFPTTGRVLIGGHDIQDDGDRARKLLSFIADMYGLPPDHARQRIADVIGLFNLHAFVDDLTERYSHGMRQRTVFASA